MGRGGKLDVNIDYVRGVDGEKIALRSVKETSGGGHIGAMTGAIVITSLVFFPAAPLFLFMHGKDITIPKGTELTAYSNGEIKLQAVKVAPKQAAVANDDLKVVSQIPTEGPKAVENAIRPQLTIVSEPSGAEIEINDEFIGNTPTTVRVKEGKVIVKVKKAGYQLWERTLTLTSGDKRNLTVDMVSGGVVKLPH